MFCIDNSGSMSTTTEIEGKVELRHGLSEEEYEMLKQFMEPGDEYQVNLGKRNVTYVSRRQCVLAAIETQINELKNTNPNKVVGLVEFNNEVTIVGDGSQQPVTIAGDRLNNFQDIKQIALQAQQSMMATPIS